MELSYIHNCQSCGAAIQLGEADRVTECSYCDTKRCMVHNGPLRFILPHNLPEAISEDELYYLPYFRFKGNIFSCVGTRLIHKVIDTTQLAYAKSSLPHNLGLRPQAMKMRLASMNQPGRFIQPTERVSEIFHRAAALSRAQPEGDDGVYHRAFIGESVSLIYLPVYSAGHELMDGVLNRSIANNFTTDLLHSASSEFRRDWVPEFLATSCPHCAAALYAERDSLVLTCFNCAHMWEERNRALSKVEFTFLSDTSADIYLPFWMARVQSENDTLKTHRDLLHMANSPLFHRSDNSLNGCSFYLPGFKIRPKYYLHLAKNLSLMQGNISAGVQEIDKRIYPVSLPLEEALQSIKTILAAVAANKRKFLPELARLQLNISKCSLVFLPFQYLGHDLVQTQSSVSIAANTLHSGRML